MHVIQYTQCIYSRTRSHWMCFWYEYSSQLSSKPD